MGATQVQLGASTVNVPRLHEVVADSDLLLGVRPEHVSFADSSTLRAEVLGSEYLGTAQIVTCTTADGSTVRAKLAPDLAVRRGEHVGLALKSDAVSLFDKASGRALRSARYEGQAHG